MAIGFVEVKFLGSPDPSDDLVEICGNGIDDDGDCDIDCEDDDCAPTILNVNVIQQPTCPICNDGEISVYTLDEDFTNLEVSIDGGNTFITPTGKIQTFSGLSDGSYSIIVRRTNSGCETIWSGNPVLLASPPGSPMSDCLNGDFEEGTLDGWNIGGSLQNGEFGFAKILPTINFADSNIPEVNGNFSALGSYMLQLGDGYKGANTDNAWFSFEIDQSNADFSFLFAVVMDDPINHEEYEKPNFIYRIEVDNNLIDEVEIISNDPFLDARDNKVFKGWTCVFYDLSTFIGQTARVVFSVNDCTLGAHEAHAYIDGLCSDIDDLKPEVSITNNNIYCGTQEVNLITTGGGYNRYQWTIGKIDINGNLYDEVIYPLEPIIGYDASIYDVLFDIYSVWDITYLECDVYYQATVTVFSECGQDEASTTFKLECQNHTLDYCDNIVVCDNTLDLTLIGTVDCEDCTYSWEPGNYFYDPNVAFPTIRGFDWTDALNRSYSVTATSPGGCVYVDVVNVFDDDGYEFSYTQNETHCKIIFYFTFDFNFEVNSNVITGFVNDLANNLSDAVFFQSLENDDKTIVVKVEIPKDRGVPLNLIGEFNVDFSSLDNVCQVGTSEQCGISQELGVFNNSLFSRSWNIYVPNGFSPNNDGNHDTFHPFFESVDDEQCDEPNHNSSIYYMKLSIYDRWGGLKFEGIASAPVGSYAGLTGEEVEWDGTYLLTGEDLDQGTYTYTLLVKSCTSMVPPICNEDPCNPDDGEYCSSGATTGDFLISGSVDLVL